MQKLNYPTQIAVEMIDTFLYGNNNNGYIAQEGNDGKGNYGNITSENYAREIAKAIGEETMLEVLHLYGCQTVKEYIQKKEKSYSTNRKR